MNIFSMDNNSMDIAFKRCINNGILDDDYVKVKKDDEYYYLAEKLATKVLGEDYEVVEKLKGKDMEYMEYEQLLPFIKVNKKHSS